MPDVPIGLSPVDDQRFDDYYAPAIGDPENYPSTQSNATAPDSTTLYRRLLQTADDRSVIIVVIGGQTCIHRLLISPTDPEGDGSIGRTGRELIEAKVRTLVIMGGNFVDPNHREHNIALDLEAASAVAESTTSSRSRTAATSPVSARSTSPAGATSRVVSERRLLETIATSSIAHSLPAEGYVGSAMIQSYTQDGQLNWQVMAQEWIDCAAVDPLTGTDVYTKKSRYALDFTKPPGQEWTLKATTVHRHLFPDDPRLKRPHKGGVLVRILDGRTGTKNPHGAGT